MEESNLTIPLPPEILWVLGAGRFGHLAVGRLQRLHPEARVTCIDVRKEKLMKLRKEFGVSIRGEDAISFLTKGPLEDKVWIVPAIPIHVAFRWILAVLEPAGRAVPIPVPRAVESEFPNPYRSTSGTVYTSFATFLCPDYCSEPDEICTHTQSARHANLFDLLSEIDLAGFKNVVIRSWQLAPGVGGYHSGQLKCALYNILSTAGHYLIATSCRCHGVVDALEWNPYERASGSKHDRSCE